MMGQESEDWRDLRELMAEAKAKRQPKRLPRKSPANLDRPLTEGERALWKRRAGFAPGPGATLLHFRRGMAGKGWSSR